MNVKPSGKRSLLNLRYVFNIRKRDVTEPRIATVNGNLCFSFWCTFNPLLPTGEGSLNTRFLIFTSALRTSPLPFYVPFWHKRCPFRIPFIEKRYTYLPGAIIGEWTGWSYERISKRGSPVLSLTFCVCSKYMTAFSILSYTSNCEISTLLYTWSWKRYSHRDALLKVDNRD